MPIFSFKSMFGEDFMGYDRPPQQDSSIFSNINVFELYDAILKLNLNYFSFKELRPRSVEPNGNKIDLIRHKIGTDIYCGICNRNHTNENIFLAIHSIHGVTHLITAHCYRRYNEMRTSNEQLTNVLMIGYYDTISKTMSVDNQNLDRLIESSTDKRFIVPKITDRDRRMIQLKWRQLMGVREMLFDNLKQSKNLNITLTSCDNFFMNNYPQRFNICKDIKNYRIQYVDEKECDVKIETQNDLQEKTIGDNCETFGDDDCYLEKVSDDIKKRNQQSIRKMACHNVSEQKSQYVKQLDAVISKFNTKIHNDTLNNLILMKKHVTLQKN